MISEEESHPNRCQAILENGQCKNISVETPDGTFATTCRNHFGARDINKNGLRNYRLTKFRARMAEKSHSGDIKNIRDEIGILRVVLEERLNQCKDGHDLILHSGPIADLVVKIEKVVSSCHKLEGSMGQLLDKSAILQFASVVISIISENIDDEHILNKIADQILEQVNNG